MNASQSTSSIARLASVHDDSLSEFNGRVTGPWAAVSLLIVTGSGASVEIEMEQRTARAAQTAEHDGGRLSEPGQQRCPGQGEERSGQTEPVANPLEPLVAEHGEWLSVIVRFVQRTVCPGFDDAELLAAARLGLVEAALRFRPERGTEFRAFAFHRVRGAIIDTMRRSSMIAPGAYRARRRIPADHVKDQAKSVGDEAKSQKVKRNGQGRRAGKEPRRGDSSAPEISAARRELGTLRYRVSLHRVPPALLPASGATSPELQLDQRMCEQLMRRAVQELPERERVILDRHYFEGESFAEIGLAHGWSRPTVSKVHHRALALLRKRLPRDMRP